MCAELIETINVLQKQLNVRLATKFEKMMDNELTAKQVLILELVRIGKTSSTELAEHAQVSTSAISQLLNKLEHQGYIVRTINPTNRRKIDIALGDKAVAYFERTMALDREINESMYGQLPEEDLQALVTILQKLLRIAEA